LRKENYNKFKCYANQGRRGPAVRPGEDGKKDKAMQFHGTWSWQNRVCGDENEARLQGGELAET